MDTQQSPISASVMLSTRGAPPLHLWIGFDTRAQSEPWLASSANRARRRHHRFHSSRCVHIRATLLSSLSWMHVNSSCALCAFFVLVAAKADDLNPACGAPVSGRQQQLITVQRASPDMGFPSGGAGSSGRGLRELMVRQQRSPEAAGHCAQWHSQPLVSIIPSDCASRPW